MKTLKLLLTLIVSIGLVLPLNSYACTNTVESLEHYIIDEETNEHHAIFKAYNYTHKLLTLESDCGGYYTFKIDFDYKEVKKLKRCDFYFAFDLVGKENQENLQYIIADYYDRAKDETILVYKY